ncbi:14898_t:CDS:10, partial [Entrophospora sp. SA101]
MFKKPISNIKQYSLLRASDRRKLKDKLISSFQTLEAFEQKNKDVENKDDASAIILPEQIQSVKITTHSGINGVLYVTQEKHPIWLTLDIDKEEILVPTVYTLWKFPDILPKIPTFRIVVDKLVGGANLMIPGIAYPPEKLPNVKIDEIVAITIQGHNYPVGIGIMKVETSSLERGSKKKGLAVQIIHMYKDYLWDMACLQNDVDEDNLTNSEPENVSVSEIDEILQASLYQALLEKLTPKETLPISGSKLYDSYLLPCRPIGTEDTVDIKKSSHKNLTKFLKAIEKKGVIKLRARKGEILLDSVNWEHDELTTFRSHKSIEKSSNVTTTGSNSEIQKIQIVEVFKPRDAVYNVYEYKELKNVVSGYVKTKNLSDRENRKFIILDELLRSIFAEKTGVAAPDKLAYNDLVYNIASDRRKLKDKLISSFQTLEAFEQKNKDVENKDDASAIILPEQIQSVKITTHSGINGVLYVTQEKHPIWLTLDIDKEEILVPTVYTLWKFPDILPKIPTFRIVVDKLVGGANLMIPGIAYPPEKLPNVKIDEIVAITIQGHNYPVGIGIMKVETSSLERGSKKKGLAVQIIHMYKDYLWDMGDKSLPSDSNDQVAAEYDEYDAA